MTIAATTPAPAAKPAASGGLPSPTEFPRASVVLYDGHCKFCAGKVKKMARWDGRGRLAFLSLHDPEVARRWPDLTHEMLMEQMYLIEPDGTRHAGAAAFRFLSRLLPKLWFVAPLMHIPFTLPLWQFLYRQIAKRRYLLMGKTADACDDGGCKVHFK